MRTDDIIGKGKLFPTQQACADALGITQGAVSHWNGLVPEYQELRLYRKYRRLEGWLKRRATC